MPRESLSHRLVMVQGGYWRVGTTFLTESVTVLDVTIPVMLRLSGIIAINDDQVYILIC